MIMSGDSSLPEEDNELRITNGEVTNKKIRNCYIRN